MRSGNSSQYTGDAPVSESRNSPENHSCRPVFHNGAEIAASRLHHYTALVKPSAIIFIILPICLIAWIGITLARPPWTPLRIAGAVIAIVGFALMTLARIQLGNAFSITPQ